MPLKLVGRRPNNLAQGVWNGQQTWSFTRWWS